MIDIVERLKEKIIVDAYTSGFITDGALCERLIRERLDAADEIEKLRQALKSILNDVGYHNPMRMTTEISDKILEDAAGALHDKNV